MCELKTLRVLIFDFFFSLKNLLELSLCAKSV